MFLNLELKLFSFTYFPRSTDYILRYPVLLYMFGTRLGKIEYDCVTMNNKGYTQIQQEYFTVGVTN